MYVLPTSFPTADAAVLNLPNLDNDICFWIFTSRSSYLNEESQKLLLLFLKVFQGY